MFFLERKDILMAKENRGTSATKVTNGSVRFSIFINTVDFSNRG